MSVSIRLETPLGLRARGKGDGRKRIAVSMRFGIHGVVNLRGRLNERVRGEALPGEAAHRLVHEGKRRSVCDLGAEAERRLGRRGAYRVSLYLSKMTNIHTHNTLSHARKFMHGSATFSPHNSAGDPAPAPRAEGFHPQIDRDRDTQAPGKSARPIL